MTDLREYVDKDHEVRNTYYDLRERYTGRNAKTIKKQLEELIEKDPDFLDSYTFLHEIMFRENKVKEAKRVLNEAYERAVNLITDENGNWPDILEWGWVENRHNIRAILNEAVLSWGSNDTEYALNLFRNLLKTNPGDNPGVRFYILAIRMGIGFRQFEKRFNRGGFYHTDLHDWFEENYRKFPDEFGWWEKAVEEYE
jgi:tetratricopeptide (TPR) repeat protein